jgi:hypothetical protein
MQKDFVTATPDTGSSGTTTVNVTAAANTGEARNTAINVSGSSISKTVQVSQEEGELRVIVDSPLYFDCSLASSYQTDKNGTFYYVNAVFDRGYVVVTWQAHIAIKNVNKIHPELTFSDLTRLMIRSVDKTSLADLNLKKYTTIYSEANNGTLTIVDLDSTDLDALNGAVPEIKNVGGTYLIHAATNGIADDVVIAFSII